MKRRELLLAASAVASGHAQQTANTGQSTSPCVDLTKGIQRRLRSKSVMTPSSGDLVLDRHLLAMMILSTHATRSAGVIKYPYFELIRDKDQATAAATLPVLTKVNAKLYTAFQGTLKATAVAVSPVAAALQQFQTAAEVVVAGIYPDNECPPFDDTVKAASTALVP